MSAYSNYLEFITFTAVVNVKTAEEFHRLVKMCNLRGLTGIKNLERFRFYELHCDCGTQVIPYGELCVEFRLSDGTFTVGDKRSYEEYGCRILSIIEI